jgi:aspartokinase
MKITDSIKAVLSSTPHLEYGFYHGLFNLTALAEFIAPAVSARSQKKLSAAALKMGLSRVSRDVRHSKAPKRRRYEALGLSIVSGLAVLTLEQTDQHHRAMNQLYNKLHQKKVHMTVTSGTVEITAVFPAHYRALVKELVSPQRHRIREDVSAISIHFHKAYIETPGFISEILQELAIQSINVIELASTATELIIYMHSKDIPLAFDTLYYRFVAK